MVNNAEEIIIYLIENNDKDINISNISKSLAIDYKNTHRLVKKLEEASAIKLEKFGNTTKCLLSHKMNPYLFSAELKRREIILKNKNIATMLKILKESSEPINYILLLFGSYAKKKQHKDSDIDLMFIISHKSIEKKIEETLSIIPLPVHAVILTESEFSDMYSRRTGNVVQEAVNNNVVLKGVEHYYEMIQ